MRKWENGIARQISEVEVDMAPFIGKADGRFKVQFAKCEIPNTFLDIEFKLSEAEAGAGGEDSGDEEGKESVYHGNSGSGNVDGKRYEDEIQQLREELQQLKAENQENLMKRNNLAQQLDLKDGVIQSLTIDKE